ncbi:hypothetical protein I4U23_008648 [Adineta vaga]|nr:hypothetical protein I4U23_008648 [Adineta vaga]
MTRINTGKSYHKDSKCYDCRKGCQLLKEYFRKWLGQHQSHQTLISFSECIITFMGTFLGLGIISIVHYRLLAKHDFIFLIGSFGASCVLLFAVPSSSLAQPRNAILGQLIGATVGCILRLISNYIHEQFLVATLSVAISILFMQLTNTLHAPGAATALSVTMTTTHFPCYRCYYC